MKQRGPWTDPDGLPMFYGADHSQEEIIYQGSFYKVEPRRMVSYWQTAYELMCRQGRVENSGFSHQPNP